MKEFNEATKKQIVSTVALSALVVAVIALLVLTNLFLSEKLLNLQSVNQTNYNLLTQIENYLSQLDKQLQAAQRQPAAASEIKSTVGEEAKKAK